MPDSKPSAKKRGLKSWVNNLKRCGVKREESSCKGSDQKGVCISHPLSLLKHELIMPLHIFMEKVMAMGGRNGTSSGIFSESDRE